jgi:hypothetical protein
VTVESSLHHELKSRYRGDGGQCEVACEGFRADAVSPGGDWIEVQSGALGPLRGKLERLLPSRRVLVVKPVVVERRIIRRSRPDGEDLSTRRSPRRGSLWDVFDDLVGLVRVFPHANLRLDVLGVAVDEVRVPCRRRPGFAVVDRRLRDVCTSRPLTTAGDLWSLLPDPWEPGRTFTTQDLSRQLSRGAAFAQRVAYCLRLSGAACVVGKVGNRLVYERADREAAGSGPRPRRVRGEATPGVDRPPDLR